MKEVAAVRSKERAEIELDHLKVITYHRLLLRSKGVAFLSLQQWVSILVNGQISSNSIPTYLKLLILLLVASLFKVLYFCVFYKSQESSQKTENMILNISTVQVCSIVFSTINVLFHSFGHRIEVICQGLSEALVLLFIWLVFWGKSSSSL